MRKGEAENKKIYKKGESMKKETIKFFAWAPLLMCIAILFFTIISLLSGVVILVLPIICLFPLEIVLSKAAMVLLIIEAGKNPLFTDNKKIVWGCLLLFLGAICYPFMWNKYIRKYEEANGMESEYADADTEAVNRSAVYYSRLVRTSDYQQKNTMVEDSKIKLVIAWLPGFLFLCFIGIAWRGIEGGSYDAFALWVLVFVIVSLLLSIVHFLAAVVFIIHMMYKGVFSVGKKVLWGILLLVFSAFTCPVYYYKYVRERE